MRVRNIKKYDIVTYRNGRTNRVHKPKKYHKWYDKDFKNKRLGSGYDIVKIERYYKFLWFISEWRTIYKR